MALATLASGLPTLNFDGISSPFGQPSNQSEDQSHVLLFTSHMTSGRVPFAAAKRIHMTSVLRCRTTAALVGLESGLTWRVLGPRADRRRNVRVDGAKHSIDAESPPRRPCGRLVLRMSEPTPVELWSDTTVGPVSPKFFRLAQAVEIFHEHHSHEPHGRFHALRGHHACEQCNWLLLLETHG